MADSMHAGRTERGTERGAESGDGSAAGSGSVSRLANNPDGAGLQFEVAQFRASGVNLADVHFLVMHHAFE